MSPAKIWDSVESFFLRPAYAFPLAALRIGLSLVLLLQAYMLRHSLVDLFGRQGLVQGDLAPFLVNPLTPKIDWFVRALAFLPLEEPSLLGVAGALYVLSLLGLLLGLFSRASAFVAWAFQWMFMATGETMSYGVDLYAHVFLFYLILVPAGDALSLDVYFGRKRNEASSAARLGLRLLQLQLCITYFFSARDKAAGAQWWNGELMWRAFTVPSFQPFDLTWTAHWPWLLTLGGWGSLFLEGGYIFFIWPRQTRKIWVCAMMGLHASIALLMGLQLFGLIMCVLTPAVFAVSAESARLPWRRSAPGLTAFP